MKTKKIQIISRNNNAKSFFVDQTWWPKFTQKMFVSGVEFVIFNPANVHILCPLKTPENQIAPQLKCVFDSTLRKKANLVLYYSWVSSFGKGIVT